ncbi:MAG: Zn-dependent alcohol dehydrogenase [Deltaproteobacteria bacterium]|nr:Zn-dependent alcohol dehydrogenase [Deltaproteobacteria bacterium]MBW2387974.1 Zn-dependent alcohol dehydrogenase [Deltaproteobacteria bacterium]MBW2724698.1 Zn-dependent alcohol dehydrogenase [Deltaproteobacteria bacterium]
MKAAILKELNADIEIRDDVTLGDLGQGEVHVKLVSSGVCHSDLSVQNGTIPMGFPVVLGHEGAGIVQEVGAGVTEVVAGDHVILSFVPACRKCVPCERGQSYLCEAAMSVGMTPHFVLDGAPIAGMTGLGTFAEELITAESCLVKVDNDIPLDIVSLIGCGVTTGVGAAINTAQVTPGSSVVVFGCGGVGMSTIQGARIAGAAEILAVDTVESKLEQAKTFGATHVCTPDALEQMKTEITGGEGFDYALECIGNPVTIRATFDAARRGGTAVIVGVGRIQEEVKFSAFEFFFTDKILRGSMYGSANVRVFMPKLLRLWKAGKLDLESMITQRIQLDDVNDAFAAMQAGQVIRSVIDYK